MIRWLRQFRQRRRLAAARRSGFGSYTNEWPLGEDPQQALEAILNWCRDTVSTCRRPYGINQFDIALTYRRVGERARTLSLRRGEPPHLYDDGSELIARVREFLSRDNARNGGDAMVSISLSSWGDLTHAAFLR